MAGFVYLAVVLDVFSRRIVGWCMRDTLHTRLVMDALETAATQRRATDFVHHSDQDSQGGFNRSSQHLQPRGVYGATRRMDEAIEREGGDVLSKGSFAPARNRASILGEDCDRNHEREGRRGGRGVAGTRRLGSGLR